MIAPGTLCRLQNPLGNAVAFLTSNGDVELVAQNHLFTIVSVPHRLRDDHRHYAYGFLEGGRMGFIDCRWLIEVREGDT